MIGNSNDKGNFPHELLLTNKQISNFCKAFANNISANINLSKVRLFKTIQIVGYLGRLLGPLLIVGLPLMKNVIKPLVKSVLKPLRLITLTADTVTQKKVFWSGTITSVISNDIIKIVKYPDDFGLLKQLKIKQKDNKVNFLVRY